MTVMVTPPIDEHTGQVDFDCPNRPGKRCYVPIREGANREHTWGWDGNIAKPTITPSIDCTQCGWHGFIRNGDIC